MELRHLKYFKTVAEELHFGKAATRLNMAQPPLSLQIRQLEEEIGVPLFHRTKRSVELTQEGEVFLEKVYHLFDNLEDAIKTVKMINRGEVGEIVIGFIATASFDLLPTIIKHYRKQYPAVQIVLKQLTSAEQIEALQAGRIQVGIVSEPIAHEGISFQVLKQEPLVIALPKEHPLASETSSADLTKFANDPFVLTSRKANQVYYDGVINCCFQAGFSPQIVQETGEMSTVLSLVSSGIGVSLVPSSIKSLLQNEVVYREVTDLPFTTVNALVWQSDIQSSITQAFVDFVKDSVIPIIR
ncbi:LysR substrate-binding domain-containing protein [Ectobacillus funiculus]|uniref:LysR substrate-binding domain-containing protein n=1 Tax=Ectobacillus funiculus TaxID=137993 RepID=UPI00397CC0CB